MSAGQVAIPAPTRIAGRVQTAVVMAVTAALIGALAFVAGGGLTDDRTTAINLTGDVAAAAPSVGTKPPDFTGLTADGRTVSLSEFAGKPVWLTFGASWCPDCRSEIADLQATYARYQPDGLVVLGVFIDEPAADIAAYAGRASLTFPIVADSQAKIASAYRSLGIPTHYFIGRDGLVKETRIGGMRADDMDRAVAAIVR